MKTIYDLEFDVTPGHDGYYMLSASVIIKDNKMIFVGAMGLEPIKELPGTYGYAEYLNE
jgi:hypothetical protein